MSKPFFLKFGRKVRELRVNAGMSQEALGLEAGISGSFVGMIERAEKDVSLSKVYKISKVLKVDIKDLF